MSQTEKNHYFHVRGVSKALKNRVKVAARKNGMSVESELRSMIEKTYPPEKKK